MARKSIWLTTLALSVFTLIGTFSYAQPQEAHRKESFGMEDGDQRRRPPRSLRMEEGNQRQRAPRQSRHQKDMGKPNRGRPPMDPKVRAQFDAIMITAEAHRKLAEIYKDQGKIDDAATQLKKIIDLADCPATKAIHGNKNKNENNKNHSFSRKVFPVYIQLAKLYVQNDRMEDAEKIINEGVIKYEKEQPHIASKLILTLGQIFTKKGETKKAEATYKRVIDLNAKALK